MCHYFLFSSDCKSFFIFSESLGESSKSFNRSCFANSYCSIQMFFALNVFLFFLVILLFHKHCESNNMQLLYFFYINISIFHVRNTLTLIVKNQNTTSDLCVFFVSIFFYMFNFIFCFARYNHTICPDQQKSNLTGCWVKWFACFLPLKSTPNADCPK